MKYAIRMSETEWRSIVSHVLPSDSDLESAAFLFAQQSIVGECRYLTVIDLMLARHCDFSYQLDDYIELSEKGRIRLQKTATVLNASIIEVHSHPRQCTAVFSLADLLGFEESVPQMRWRLHDRPYSAIVVTPTSFDALIWWDTATPVAVDAVELETQSLQPTGRTLEGVYASRCT